MGTAAHPALPAPSGTVQLPGVLREDVQGLGHYCKPFNLSEVHAVGVLLEVSWAGALQGDAAPQRAGRQ